LADGQQPLTVSNAIISMSAIGGDLKGADVSFYDPWSDRWTRGVVDGGRIALPDFTRSIVIKMRY
jgi:hypothetical protein